MNHKMNTSLQHILANVVLLLLVISGYAYASEKITFYHYDLLGSPVATTNEKGEVLWREEYSPYGDKLLNQDAASDNARGYTGHVHDAETGLTYMQARYYDPEIGRFMSIDPVGFKPDNPLSFNRYAYGNNNPYKYIDPNGMEPDDGLGEDFGDPIGLGPDAVSMADEFSAERAENSSSADLDTVSIIDPFTKMKGAIFLGGILKQSTKRLGKANTNKLNHIFGQQKHKLDTLVNKFKGDQERAFQALDNAAQKALKEGKLNLKNGINTQTRVNVNGVEVDLIGGKVVGGKFNIGSASRRDIK